MNVQYSIFSNNRIEPTPDVVNDLLSELNAMGKYVFIPSMISGQNIDLLAGKVNPMNNISFVTQVSQKLFSSIANNIKVSSREK